jgi:hypothetical protein
MNNLYFLILPLFLILGLHKEEGFGCNPDYLTFDFKLALLRSLVLIAFLSLLNFFGFFRQ